MQSYVAEGMPEERAFVLISDVHVPPTTIELLVRFPRIGPVLNRRDRCDAASNIMWSVNAVARRAAWVHSGSVLEWYGLIR